MARLFFLGATGHIGGAVVNALLREFPDLEITAVVRDARKAERLVQVFPRMRTVIGDLTNTDLIEDESRAAGIVINTSPDWLEGSAAAIKAILRGLDSSPQKGFYIQTSGAFLVGEPSAGSAPSGKVWDDVQDIEQITTMPPGRYHQAADQLVRDEAASVNYALVSPTVVYGRGTSSESQIPITIRDIVATVIELSAGFTIAQGKNSLPYIHVDDLAAIYVALFSDAAKGANSNARLWGPQAYYFAVSEELSFAEYMKEIVGILHGNGILPGSTIKEIGPLSDASDLAIVNKTADVHGYGTSLRVRGSRSETLLGWKPEQPSVKDTLPEILGLITSGGQS